MAAAGRALPRLRARIGAGAGAGLAGDRGRHADRGVLAGEGLFQPDLEVVAQIGTAFAAIGTARPAAAGVAEEGIEDVRHEVGEVGIAAAPAALLEGGMAVAVIERALLPVGEDLIGLVDLLELDLGLQVAGILVRMVLHGQLAEGALQLDLRGGAADAEDLVIVALRHRNVLSLCPCASWPGLTRPSPAEEPLCSAMTPSRNEMAGSSPAMTSLSMKSALRRSFSCRPRRP